MHGPVVSGVGDGDCRMTPMSSASRPNTVGSCDGELLQMSEIHLGSFRLLPDSPPTFDGGGGDDSSASGASLWSPVSMKRVLKQDCPQEMKTSS